MYVNISFILFQESGVLQGCSIISRDFAREDRNFVVIHDCHDLKAGNICYFQNGSDGVFYFVLGKMNKEFVKCL